MRIEIFPAAEGRLIQIWDYTESAWGEKQADIYIDELIAKVNDVANKRHLWRMVGEDIVANAFFVRYRHHYIFFRELSNSLGVISVLHQNMDIPARLKEDNERAPE